MQSFPNKAQIGFSHQSYRALLLCSLLLASPLSLAESSIKVGVQGVLNYAGNSSLYGDSFDRKFGLGGGLLFDLLPKDSFLDFRIALQYLNRNFQESYQGATGNINSKVLEIPLLVHWHLLPWVSIGTGFYYFHTLGQLSIEANGNKFSEDYIGDSGNRTPWTFKTDEWGWIASLNGTIPVTKRIDVIIEGSYQRQVRWESFYITSDFLISTGIRFSLERSQSPLTGPDETQKELH